MDYVRDAATQTRLIAPMRQSVVNILMYDTETTGLPIRPSVPYKHENWPHIVQLSYLVYSLPVAQFTEGVPSTWTPVASGDFVVLPDGYKVPEEASKIHGISHARAVRDGIDVREVMENFLFHVARADIIVAHNANFDKNTVHGVLARNGMLATRPIGNEDGPWAQGSWPSKPTVREICTMLASTEYCRLPFEPKDNTAPPPYPKDTRFKWPRLSQLFKVLFPHEPVPLGLHNSLVDVQCTARCFFRLLELGIVTPTLCVAAPVRV